MKKLIKFIPIVLIIAILSMFTLSGCTKNENTVVIATKNYTEQRIIGQMLAIYIEENTDYDTKVRELGGTMLCYNALKKDEIDMYAEYTGSGYAAVLGQKGNLSPDEIYDYVKLECEKQHGITWLNPLGWNNTYVLSVMPSTAEQYNLKTISDLIPIANTLRLSSDNEFVAREDGLVGLKKAYGLSFKEERPMDQGLTYAAVRDGQVDINSSFSTDGRISKFGLINLEDDKNFFIPYYVTPILKMAYAEKHPELVELLKALGGVWNEAEMQGYNLQVDEGADVKTVARAMLTAKNLI